MNKRNNTQRNNTQRNNTQRFKKLIIFQLVFIFFFFLTNTSVNAEELQPNKPKEGFNYYEFTTPAQQIVHVLEIDPKRYSIRLVHAKDKVLGVDTVSHLANRFQALAGINGGFFKMGFELEGTPAGILKIDGRWFGIAYRNRGAIGWSDEQNFLIDRVQTKTSLTINRTRYPVHKLNFPSENKTVLYTESYGKSVQHRHGGIHVIIANNQIIDIVPAKQKTEIPKDGFVYSISTKMKIPAEHIQKLRVGNPVHIDITLVPHFNRQATKEWQSCNNIVGGAPILIHNGSIVNNYSPEGLPAKFIHKPYARTAIGKKRDGSLVFVVIERSQITNSPGMTLSELATTLLNLGCISALNLDGGGSSTFFIDDRIVNHPQGELDENTAMPLVRKVSDAILVIAK